MDFFKNGTGWCRRHDPSATAPEPIRKSHAPIFRKLQAASAKHQASSAKHQAPSSESFKRQASQPE